MLNYKHLVTLFKHLRIQYTRDSLPYIYLVSSCFIVFIIVEYKEKWLPLIST